MRKYILLIVVIVLANSQLQLTAQNFIEHLAANEFIFIKFYSPNCANCIAMTPEYQQFAKQAEGKSYKVAEIDCSEHRQLCQQNGVKTYPTLQLFVSGSAFNYEGKRTAAALSSWMEEITSLKLQKLSISEAKKKIGKETFALISGLSEKVQRVVAVTSSLIDYRIKYYSFDSQGYIKLYLKGSYVPLQYTTDQDFPFSLVEWTFQKSRPALVPLETQVLKYAKEQKQYSHLLIVFEKENVGLEDIASWCSKNLENVLCLSVNQDSSVFEQISNIAKIPETKLPLFIAKKDFTTGSHYPYESITAQHLTNFLESVKANKLPHDIDALRDLRERVKFNSVVKLDSTNYYQTIAENQFVFVYYFSPNCGHCIKFAPDFDRVGAHFKELGSTIVIAAIDVNEETLIKEKEKVHGFPHFRLFIRGNKILYRKDRNADVMIEFIASASTTKLTKVQSLEEISDQTFAILSGVPENTYLHALPALFKNCTIYLLPSEGNLSLAVHNGGRVFKYKGKADFWEIYDWLDVEFLPILSSLGVSKPAKRLQKALIARIPILLVLNKQQRSAVDQLLVILQDYCTDKRDFVCGYIHSDEEDYKMLNDWLGESTFPYNSIFWVDTDTNARYKYTDSLSEVSIDSLAVFVEAIKNGSIPIHVKPAQESKPSNEEL